MPSKSEELINKAFTIAKSKKTRNIFFLVVSIIIVLAINSLLPIIEGSSRYTEAVQEMTYTEYLDKYEENHNYNLTFASNIELQKYLNDYCEEHGISKTERYNITPPDNFKVKVYTKFFFEYPFWWLSTLTQIVSVLLIYYSVFNFILSKRKLTEERYVSLKKEVEDASNNSLDPITFEPWMIHSFNKTRKISQHKANIKYKLELLLKHTKYSIRNGAEDDPKRIKYETKKKELEEQLSDEYIDKYLPGMKVKGFTYIHPTFVTSGYNVVGRSHDSYSLLYSDAQKLSRDSMIKMISTFLFTSLFAVLVTFTATTSMEQPWYWIVINILTKIVPMVVQIPLAYDYCDSFMENHLITNLISRRNIILLYLADQSNPKLPEPKVVVQEVTDHAQEDNTGS